jgi:hypothetical protein
MSSEPTDIEKENLESHVELCALRYTSLERRLTRIEDAVEELQQLVQRSHMSTIKVLVATAGTVIAGVLSTIVVLLINFL